MSMPAGRSEKWTPIKLSVALSCVGQRSSKEQTLICARDEREQLGEEDAGDAAESQDIMGSRSWNIAVRRDLSWRT